MNEQDTKLMNTAIKKIAPAIYKDALSPAFKKLGKFGEDIVSTIRLVAFPIQYGALFQKRLEQHLQKILSKIPKDKLTFPHDAIQIPILEQLKNYDKNEMHNEAIIAEMYQNLLASSYHKNTSKLVHPRFVKIISELSTDEGLLFKTIGLNKNKYVFYMGDLNERKLYIKQNNFKSIFQYDTTDKQINRNNIYTYYDIIGINLDNLINPDYAGMYIDNLQNLGLITFQSSSAKIFKIRVKGLSRFDTNGLIYNLSDFGKLLFGIINNT